ncbi:MAG: hypothetical protein M1829_003078 [Trizodia sp. TS-e1964]|nr:MAG: hypothetical protein M1829_003078 [Trizodia sp. TS-e1964]
MLQSPLRHPTRRALLRPLLPHLLKPPLRSTHFSTSPTPPQTYSVTRTLPYARLPLFTLIANIDAYASFLPYCERSRVTAWSAPPALPTAAELVVGWRGFEETFISDVRCVPGESVLATAGGAQLFRSLATRWALKEAKGGGTEVGLTIEVVFRSSWVGAVSEAAAPRVAAGVIQAFERRAREVLGPGRAEGGKTV